MRYAARACLLIASTSLAGCVSWLSSDKVNDDDNAEGVRYSLPQPFLLVTPKADGTVDVEVVLLPDSSKTYTIRQPSFIASHTLNVELDNQMLKAVDLNADTGATSAKAIEGYGEYRKAAIEAEAEQAKGAADKAAAAKKRVADAELAVAKAQAVVNYLEPDKNQPSVVAEYIKAQIALQQAQAELAAAQDDARSLGISGFNVPGTTPRSQPTAFGPVLYSINQQPKEGGGYTVDLNATKFPGNSDQYQFPTSRIALPAEDKPGEFALDPAADISTGNNSVLETSTTLPVTEIDPDPNRHSITRTDGTKLPAKPDIVKFGNGRKLKIGFPKNLPRGDYMVTMSLKVGNEEGFTSHDFKILRR